MKSPNPLPPMNSLKVFETVARHLNFRLAAEEISVTHGAVSQQIKGLEDYLEVKLFNRLARGLSLTEDGIRYIQPIRDALNQISEATVNLKPNKNIVSLSLTPSFATKWFMPRLGLFKESYPDHDVKILATESLTDLSADGVDVAVRLSHLPFSVKLQSELLFRNEFIAVCSPGYQAHHLPDLSFDTLRHQIFLFDAHDQWPQYLNQLFPNQTIKFENAVSFNQTALAIDAAIASQGIALVSKILVLEELKGKRLCQPLSAELKSDIGYYMVNLKSKENNKSVKVIKNWLRAQI